MRLCDIESSEMAMLLDHTSVTSYGRHTMNLETHAHDSKLSLNTRRLLIGLAAFSIGLLGTISMSGCLAAVAGGAGYAVGHEMGEDHVEEGKHGDDD